MALRDLDRPFVPGVRWEDQACVKALMREGVPPHGRSTWVEGRPVGHGQDDVTDFSYGSCLLTENYWAEVMYLLEPPAERTEYAQRERQGPKKDGDGQIVYEQWPITTNGRPERARPLRHFPGVPDRIGSEETWWMIEHWRRVHPNLQWQDIMMRMEPPEGVRTQVEDRRMRNRLNLVNTRTNYRRYSLASWWTRGFETPATRELRESLTRTQIRTNSTRGTTPGMINPAGPDIAENRVPWPENSAVASSAAASPLPPRADAEAAETDAAEQSAAVSQLTGTDGGEWEGFSDGNEGWREEQVQEEERRDEDSQQGDSGPEYIDPALT